MDDIILEVEGGYIGVAFSPIVSIDETEDSYIVTITDYQGDHSYIVPDVSAAEAARVIAEQERIANEAVRVSAESARAMAEELRLSAESSRSAAEEVRSSAESSRASDEQERVDAESRRTSAESARVTAEQGRANAETVRASAETLRASSETARASAESSRATAESTRASNETARTSAESARVTAEQGRVSAESARASAEQGRIDAEVSRAVYYDGFEDTIAHKAEIDGRYPAMSVGVADNMVGQHPIQASFLHRTAGGSADITDGVATIGEIRGRTLVWNQLANPAARTDSGIVATVDNGTITFIGTTTADTVYLNLATGLRYLANHKYIFIASGLGGLNSSDYAFSTNSAAGFAPLLNNIGSDGTLRYYAQSIRDMALNFSIRVKNAGTSVNITAVPQIFDLTLMFGAGNEPATVEEFEALFPKPYYPHDAGSLLSVDMEGIRTVGFNQWDEEWEAGGISTSGDNTSTSGYYRSKNYIPVIGGASYWVKFPVYMHVMYYDSNKTFIGYRDVVKDEAITLPSGCAFIRFRNSTASMWIPYNHDICINLSWSGYRNGEYEPHWESERLMPASDYFPYGMNDVGTFWDELTSTQAAKRIGIGTIGRIGAVSATADNKYVACYDTGVDSYPSSASAPNGFGNVWNSVTGLGTAFGGNPGKLTVRRAWNGIYAYAPPDADDSIFSQLVGSKVAYVLATPIVTPIDPPLNLSYRVSDFGTEEVMTDGESAPPTMAIAYPETSNTIRDNALSAIAQVESLKAISNHAVGSYLIFQGALYKATRAIASGEAIVPGTNVTATTVMAELMALTS